MQIHDLKRNKANRKKRVIGRGGKRGKTSGRGTKGQLARSGRKLRPAMREIIKKLPKKRGYRFKSIVGKNSPVNVEFLEAAFATGSTITPRRLVEEGLVRMVAGRIPEIKILGDGDVSKKFIIEGCKVSKSAKEKIEKAGGEVK